MVVERAPQLKPVEFIDSRRKAIADLEQAVKLGVVALDSEFDSISHRDKELVIWSYSGGAGMRKVILGKYATTVYAEWLCDPKVKKVYSDYKADARVFRKLGLDLDASFHADITSMEWHRDEHLKKHGLKEQAGRWLGRRRLAYNKLFCYTPPGRKKEVTLKPSQIMGLAPLPEDCEIDIETLRAAFLSYSGDDAEDTYLLYAKHRKYLEQVGYWPSYQRVDIPYTLTLMRCDERGIPIDQDRMREIQGLARGDELRAAHAFKASVERPDLNLNSRPQLLDLLVSELEWPEYEDMRTPSGEQKVGKASFDRWEKDGYPLAGLLVRRTTKRKLGSDLKSMLSGVSPDGRLRSDYNPQGASTGRSSSRKWTEEVVVERTLKSGKIKTEVKKKKVGSNLQNVVGGGEKDPYGVRGAFVASKKGDVLADGSIAKEDYDIVCCDEAGFELVIAIHFASEAHPKSSMLEAMVKYGSPSAVHALTCIRSFDLPISIDEWMADPDGCKKRWPDFYRTSKELNFGRLYGGTAWTFAKRRKQDPRDQRVLDENQALCDKFDSSYPEIVAYQKWAIQHGYDHGWVPTIGGRRCHVAEGLASSRDRIREHWERYCCNAIIQGSAADIIKVAMNSIEADEEIRSLGGFQLAQVHDEIVLEAPKSTGEQVKDRVCHLMRQPYKKKLRVPLVVEGKVAPNWKLAK